MSLISLGIIIFSFFVGIYIGSVIFGKEIPEVVFSSQKKTDLLEQKLRYTPVVKNFRFPQGLTKAHLVADVLNPCMAEFCEHFECSDESFKYCEYINKLADRILQWYNPEYGELLLIAHDSDCDGWVIDFTWKKPKQKPSAFICPREAVDGMEMYYNNPIALYSQEDK